MKNCCFILMFFTCVAAAQVNERFDDGDFTQTPVWSGSEEKFIVTGNLLQSNSIIRNDTFYLTTPSAFARVAQWEFNVNLKFNTSSTNYTDIYLICDSADLKNAARQGYFVRIGGTSDEVSLYRRKNGTNTEIIDGLNSQTNRSNNTVKVKITRNANNLWTLKRDLTGTGYNYVTEGTTTDSTFSTSSYFGILVKQSTTSFHLKHFFDNINVTSYVEDTTPPAISSIRVVSNNQLDVLFNEYVDFNTSNDSANYFINNAIGNPLTAFRDIANPQIVHLTFLTPFTDSLFNTLMITNVEDFEANNIDTTYLSFTYYAPLSPNFKDVIINEIFADPSPTAGLPGTEFIEIYNRSLKNFTLKNWVIADMSQTATITAVDDSIAPYEYVILCSVSDTALFQPYGRVIGVSGFPSLNNDGDNLYLISNTNEVTDSVNYTDKWYNSSAKNDGGFTLELINPNFGNNCNASLNWSASDNSNGGTPGRINSIYHNDNESPQLLKINALSSDSVELVFDEALDTMSFKNTFIYSVNNNAGNPIEVFVSQHNNALLTFSPSLTEGLIYTLVISGSIKDCALNTIHPNTEKDFIVPQQAVSGDIVINEVLANPNIGGVDFVELYNRSNKIIDLKTIYISQYDTINNIPFTKKIITDTTILFYPKQYKVLSENSDVVKQQYTTLNPSGFVDLKDLPAMNIETGAISITTSTLIIDYFIYNENMHFALLEDTKGISLERIDFNRSTNDKTNWHSASQTSGFATPAYENSQYNAAVDSENNVEFNDELFSPDEDGIKDILTINYHFKSSGFVGNILIYDSKGRLVRNLVKNQLLGTRGSYSWDGIDDNNEKSHIGIYVVYFEAFDLSGNVKQFKKPCVLAGKLN